ncbi:hypothetical protein C8J56DRAFT_900481 [Mycena floridula]|nr:hypothetical protein C8J56DRAFT_900481 [Mycena floridula]
MKTLKGLPWIWLNSVGDGLKNVHTTACKIHPKSFGRSRLLFGRFSDGEDQLDKKLAWTMSHGAKTLPTALFKGGKSSDDSLSAMREVRAISRAIGRQRENMVLGISFGLAILKKPLVHGTSVAKWRSHAGRR